MGACKIAAHSLRLQRLLHVLDGSRLRFEMPRREPGETDASPSLNERFSPQAGSVPVEDEVPSSGGAQQEDRRAQQRQFRNRA